MAVVVKASALCWGFFCLPKNRNNGIIVLAMTNPSHPLRADTFWRGAFYLFYFDTNATILMDTVKSCRLR